jgi:hypothetical protein
MGGRGGKWRWGERLAWGGLRACWAELGWSGLYAGWVALVWAGLYACWAGRGRLARFFSRLVCTLPGLLWAGLYVALSGFLWAGMHAAWAGSVLFGLVVCMHADLLTWAGLGWYIPGTDPSRGPAGARREAWMRTGRCVRVVV